jgi:hypothetical protein
LSTRTDACVDINGRTGGRNAIEHIIKINVLAPNRDHGALGKVCAKPGHISKTVKDHREVLNVLLIRSHQNGRIIRIKRGARKYFVIRKLNPFLAASSSQQPVMAHGF